MGEAPRLTFRSDVDVAPAFQTKSSRIRVGCCHPSMRRCSFSPRVHSSHTGTKHTAVGLRPHPQTKTGTRTNTPRRGRSARNADGTNTDLRGRAVVERRRGDQVHVAQGCGKAQKGPRHERSECRSSAKQAPNPAPSHVGARRFGTKLHRQTTKNKKTR